MADFKNRINLQLFAEPNTQTTMTESLSPEMKTFYSKDLIETVGANLVHAQFGEETSLPAHGGKTIEWRRWGKFKKALKPLTEGVTPDGSPISVGKIVKELNQFGDYTTTSDILELTAIDNTIVEITAKHAENATLTLDTIVRNDISAGTNVLYADRIVGDVVSTVDERFLLDSNAKLTPDTIARAAAALKKANAPKIDGSYVCIIHPSVAYDVIRHPEWIDVNKYSNAIAIFNGEIGKMYGVRFVESTEATIFWGENLGSADDQRTLTVKSVDGVTVTCNEAVADLTGRTLIIKDANAGADTYVAVTVSSSEGNTLTLEEAPEGFTIEANDILYPGEGGREGCAAYSCLFLGKGAYKVVKLDGKSMEIIVKQRGSAGTADPLEQRATIGWKANGYGAAVTIPEYIVRVECGSYFSNTDTAN